MEVLNHLIEFFSIYGYWAVLTILIICGFGIPIPEDITLIAGGVICALADSNMITVVHHVDVHHMVLVSLFGVLIGDSIMFFLGKWLGDRVKTLPLLRLVFTEKAYAVMQEKTEKYGSKVLFIARFLPGVRATIFVTAGVTRKVSWFRFIAFDGSAALISVPIWVYMGYFFAQDLPDLVSWVKKSEYAIFLGLGIVIAYFVFRYFRTKWKNKS